MQNTLVIRVFQNVEGEIKCNHPNRMAKYYKCHEFIERAFLAVLEGDLRLPKHLCFDICT